jgi:alkylhydroperoxidase/carboxymuconolactone decarboxylase family protein YurZ
MKFTVPAATTAGVYAACVKLREAVSLKLGLDPAASEFADGRVLAGGKSLPLRRAAEDAELVAEDVMEYGDHAVYNATGVRVLVLALTASVAMAAGQAEPAATLSARQQAIPLIAASMAVSDMPRLNAALNDGLGAGLTVSEAKEILVHLYAYAGFPRSLNALGELMKVLEDRRKRGIQDQPGRESSAKVPTGEALLAVGTANQTRISGAPVKGPVFDFAPVINQFLQAHLFGDIFERDNLDWRSRELATVGALAATPGAEAQLRSHLRASLNVGLTAPQLRQLVNALAAGGDAVAAERARLALDALR